MGRSKLDPAQITQMEHDEVSKAKRVRMVGTEISIELDHKDGDSVTVHPAKLIASVTGVEASDNDSEIIPALDCSSISKVKVHVDGSGTVKIMISPVDSGSLFIEASAADLNDLVARRIKVISVDVVGDVHLVGRS